MYNHPHNEDLYRESKKHIKSIRVEDKGSTVSWLLLFPFVSFFTFFSVSFSSSKTKAMHQTTKDHKTIDQYTHFLLFFFSQNLVMAPWKTYSGKILQFSLFFFWSSNTQEPDNQLCQYYQLGTISKILPLIPSNTDKLYALVIKKLGLIWPKSSSKKRPG